MTTKPLKYDALLMVAGSETDANILYATRFFVPDPVIYFQIRKKTYLVLSDLEIDRANKTALVDQVLSLSAITKSLNKIGIKKPGSVEIIDHVFNKRKIASILVPENFPIKIADGLRKKKYKVHFKVDPFFDSRQFKTPQEVKHIRESLRAAEQGMSAGINLVKKSRIGTDGFLYINGEKLTSEMVKEKVNSAIMGMGFVPSHTIISSGNQCCDPHNEGSGPIRANSSIIFDIFPRSQKTGYFGDMSRTVVKGKASARLKEAFYTVMEGQKIGFRKIKDGVDGKISMRRYNNFLQKMDFLPAKEKIEWKDFSMEPDTE